MLNRIERHPAHDPCCRIAVQVGDIGMAELMEGQRNDDGRQNINQAFQ